MTKMLNIRNLSRGASAAAIGVLALCLLAGTALAFWTAGGTGSGAGKAGSLGSPTITSVTAPTNTSGSLAIAWTPPSPTSAPVTGYRVTLDNNVASGCTASPCTVSGLTPDTTYSVVVISLLNNSWTAPSSPMSGRTNAPAPSGFAFTTPANGSTLTSAPTTFAGTTNATTAVTVFVHPGSDTMTASIRGPLTATANGVSWSVPAETALPTGTYTAAATQSTTGGSVAATTTFTIAPPAPTDTTPPTQQITAPSADVNVIAGASIPVTGTASDPSGVTSLRLQSSTDGSNWSVPFGTTGTAAANGTATTTGTVIAPASGFIKLRTVASDGINAGNSLVRTMTVHSATKLALELPTGDWTAGNARTVTITAQTADGTTDTAYTGSKALTWAGSAYVGPPVGTAPASVTFSAGTASASVILKKSGTGNVIVSTSGLAASPAAIATVVPGARAGLAWSNSSSSCASGAVIVGNGGSWTSKVTVIDAFGNAAPGAAATVSVSRSPVQGSLTGTSLSIPNSTTTAETATGLSMTIPGGSPPDITVTASLSTFSLNCIVRKN